MTVGPLVSIIIRTYNEEKHIEQLLKEIFAQNVPFEFEVVVVDSGSSDRTRDIVASFPVELVRITPEEFTFGYSLNKGIEKARGDYCVIISAHCHPVGLDWLKNLIEPFKNPLVALVYGMQRGNKISKFSEKELFKTWFPDKDILNCTTPFCNNANSAIRRSLWEVIKFDETLTGFEDIDWGKKVHQKNYQIYYCSNACVYHVHDESYFQIFRRYYREALAYREIFPKERFRFRDFLRFYILNIFHDFKSAFNEKIFLRNFFSILSFRFLQFSATYKAHRVYKKIDHKMQQQLFYPHRRARDILFETVSFQDSSQRMVYEEEKPSIIDISRTLSENLPVWPGSRCFERRVTKTLDSCGVNESEISLNIHTGTHIDCPSHFLKDSDSLQNMDLTKLVGPAFVVEYRGESSIGIDFLQSLDFSHKPKRIIFKTKNSSQSQKEFDRKFIALSAEAAQWLSDKDFILVGVDGPSVQNFSDLNNKTHEILLAKKIVILEGLDLKSARTGVYTLIVLPLKIDDAEGAPARAILIENKL